MIDTLFNILLHAVETAFFINDSINIAWLIYWTIYLLRIADLRNFYKNITVSVSFIFYNTLLHPLENTLFIKFDKNKAVKVAYINYLLKRMDFRNFYIYITDFSILE